MRRSRHAKIVATLGPASSSPEMIRALFEAGADVFRFNFSHGSHEDHQKRYDIVRSIEQETGRPIAVLADLQGPKLRVGRLAEVRSPWTKESGSASTSSPRRARASASRCPTRRCLRRSRPAFSCSSMTARCASKSRRPPKTLQWRAS